MNSLNIEPNLLKILVFLKPVIVFLVMLIFGYILRKYLFDKLLKWAGKTKTDLDDIVIHAARNPFIIWCVMFGIYFALKTSQLPEDVVNIAGKVLLVLGIISVSIVISNIATAFIKSHSGKIESTMPVTSLTQNIARIIVFTVGILIILNSLGISIAPILATLGVGGLAVALALQDTLSNFFSGFHIIASKQVRIGDYIKLDTGDEGYVTDINWRTTKIQMLANNVVLVPNSKLTQSIITNYYLPSKDLAVLINLGVHYNSDLNKVEKVVTGVAKQVMNDVLGKDFQFDPFIRYHTFADSSIQFTVIMRGKEFVDQYLLKHEFVKKLHERFKEEGIVIPYPIRTVIQG